MMAMLSPKRIRTLSAAGSTSTPHQTSSSSADAVGSNADLLTDILLRLPVRSLTRFKSVSKHWFSLISSPHFSRRRNPNPNSVSGLFLTKSSSLESTDFEFLPLDGKPSSSHPNLPPWITLLQSCNGLLCCCGHQKRETNRSYYIYNPTTHQVTILPELGFMDYRTIAGVTLAFDPSKSHHYKVVCVRQTHSIGRGRGRGHKYWIEIYSSETATWKLSGDPFYRAPTAFDKGVFWNGAVHWISILGTMVSFDVDQEQLRQTPLPQNLHHWTELRIRYFGESRDHLHLILNSVLSIRQLEVYEMEKDYSGWFLKYQIDLDADAVKIDMGGSNFDTSNLNNFDICVLCIVREENDEDSYLVLQISGKAICYSFKDKTFKKLRDLANGMLSGNFLMFQCGSRATSRLLMLPILDGWDERRFRYLGSLAAICILLRSMPRTLNGSTSMR